MEKRKRAKLTLDDVMNPYWIKGYAQSVNKSIGDGDNERDLTCWSMYYSRQKESDYDYLTRYGEFDIPVKVRITSIVKPNIDWLVSKYMSNPFNFSVKTVDRKSLDKKYAKKVEAYVESVIQGIDEKYLTIQTQIQQINDKREELNLLLQQEPESQEHAQQLEQLKQQMPVLQLKFQQLTNALTRELSKVEKQKQNADILSGFKPKDIREDFVQRKMVNFYEENLIANENKMSMTEKCVTGKPAIFVDFEGNKLVYRNIPAIAIHQPKSGSLRNAEEGDWISYDENLSYDKVISMWGDQMLPNDLKQLEPFSHNGKNSYKEVYTDSDEGAANYVEGYKPTISRNNIRVRRIYFQAEVCIDFIKSPTKDMKFEHIKVKKDTDRVRENQKVESRFKNYAFEAVVINDNIYTGLKMRDKQILSIDNYGWNQLPIITDAYDDVTRVAYSMIWATKDLQALYQIIEYYEELLLVISGVKGYMMDKSQIPDGMTPKEWQYFRKMGTVWIETYKKDRRQQTSFNQFQSYDDSIPASIQYLGMMKDRISARVDQITGVTRQARGEFQERDAVGNSKMSTQATSIIADVTYWEHDQIVRRAMSRALNLYCKFVGKDGETFTIFDKSVEEFDTVNIPKGLLDGADYKCFVMNNNKDIREMQEIKQMIMNEYGRGTMSFLGAMKTFQSTSITEMRKVAEGLFKEAQTGAADAEQRRIEGERSLLEYQNQLAMNLKQAENQLKQIDQELTKKDLEIKQQKDIFDNEIQKQKIASDNYTKVLDIMIKKDTDDNRLEADIKSTEIDQLLKQAEIYTAAALQSQKNIIDDRKMDTRVNSK